MFERMTVYRAYCDECDRRYDVAAPKSALITHLRMNGWRVDKDIVICSDCIAKEEEE